MIIDGREPPDVRDGCVACLRSRAILFEGLYLTAAGLAATAQRDQAPAGYVVLVQYRTGGYGLAGGDIWPTAEQARRETAHPPADPGEPQHLGAVYLLPAETSSDDAG